MRFVYATLLIAILLIQPAMAECDHCSQILQDNVVSYFEFADANSYQTYYEDIRKKTFAQIEKEANSGSYSASIPIPVKMLKAVFTLGISLGWDKQRDKTIETLDSQHVLATISSFSETVKNQKFMPEKAIEEWGRCVRDCHAGKKWGLFATQSTPLPNRDFTVKVRWSRDSNSSGRSQVKLNKPVAIGATFKPAPNQTFPVDLKAGSPLVFTFHRDSAKYPGHIEFTAQNGGSCTIELPISFPRIWPVTLHTESDWTHVRLENTTAEFVYEGYCGTSGKIDQLQLWKKYLGIARRNQDFSPVDFTFGIRTKDNRVKGKLIIGGHGPASLSIGGHPVNITAKPGESVNEVPFDIDLDNSTGYF